MVSDSVKRGWIEIGSHATLFQVYVLVATILAINFIAAAAAIIFAAPPVSIVFIAGFSLGLMVFMIISSSIVKADKISRKYDGYNG